MNADNLKYSQAYVDAQRDEIERLRGEALTHGNVMGRIAVALFGAQNNRTDEECVAAAAEVGYGLTGCRERTAKLEAEIERLRADLLTARGEAEDLSGEVERLRGLLREALRIDAGDFNVNVDDWLTRVREALGE